MTPPQESQQNNGNGSGKKKWIIIALILLLVAGAAGYFLLGPKFGIFASDNEVLFSAQLETFTVNLEDNNYRRYLRTDITLEYSDKDIGKEIEEKKYKIRDKIISVLTQKSIEDFDSDQKREKVRIELIQAVNTILTQNGQIKALYFEDFIIQ